MLLRTSYAGTGRTVLRYPAPCKQGQCPRPGTTEAAPGLAASATRLKFMLSILTLFFVFLFFYAIVRAPPKPR